MKRIIFVLVALVTLIGSAQTTRKYSNEFLNIGVDAGALGMSNAVVATSGDVNSGYWNPAGLINLEDNQASFMHASYFANIANYDYLAFGMPLDEKSAIAFSLIRFGVDDILDTTSLVDADGNIDYTRINLFSAADYAFTFSYSRKLPIEGLSYGANAKVVRRVIGDFASSWGFGFDAALQYKRNNWQFGIMVRDITTTFNAWTIEEFTVGDLNGDGIPDEQQIPQLRDQELPETTEITIPKLQFGAARSFDLGKKFSLNTELDMNVRFAETNDIISSSAISVTPAFGFALDYSEIVYLRGGVGNFQNIEQFDGSDEVGFQPNFGVGFQYKGIQVDYALTDIGDQSAAIYSNVFSIKVDWSVFR
ncbi:PorV/PorQ family protein [Aquimarina sp. 2201CG5-10]|uniref:putative type IX sorting system protein PorV2 n=1 Tax=Aquimarina callyspongiae TaxID=3098150 RepID=UPI002AB566F7|nr:PorV/PorQ family protein [Aquimarina sp. 2201CG5-10]MDY8137845.1 PorV/PorQ family protein [Aquimarina sp. 2201CG5-10]